MTTNDHYEEHHNKNEISDDDATRTTPTAVDDPYHEKQRYLFCGIHAVNNLLGGPSFVSKAIMDAIAYRLASNTGTSTTTTAITTTTGVSSWIHNNATNPHKSMFGVGNYDVNVIMMALQEQGYDTQYLDTRNDDWKLILHQQEEEDEKEQSIPTKPGAVGLICNVSGRQWWMPGIFSSYSRHWKAIKFVRTVSIRSPRLTTSTATATTTISYYDLDSKLSEPYKFISREEFIQHMTDLIQNDDEPNLCTLLLISPQQQH